MKNKITTVIDALTLANVVIFALCVCGVLLAGAGVYEKSVKNIEKNYRSETALQYVSTKMRSADTIAVEEFEGVQSLCFYDTVDGEKYITRVYCDGGYLKELFSGVNANLKPEDGEKIVRAEQLKAGIDSNTICIDMDGESLVFSIRVGKEVSQ